MIRAVLFDVDGTLIDSNDLHAQAWQRTFQHFGLEIPYQKLRSQIGKGGDNYIPHFLTTEQDEKFGKELDRYKSELFKREYASKIRPFPRVRELFERIRREGLDIALATSSKGEELEQYERVLNIEGLVNERTSKDDAERSKPSPDIFAAALERLGVNAADAIAVGDTPFDIQACNKLGLRAIGVLCGGFPEEELLQAGCYAIYRDPADLLKNFDDSPLRVEKVA